MHNPEYVDDFSFGFCDALLCAFEAPLPAKSAHKVSHLCHLRVYCVTVVYHATVYDYHMQALFTLLTFVSCNLVQHGTGRPTTTMFMPTSGLCPRNVGICTESRWTPTYGDSLHPLCNTSRTALPCAAGCPARTVFMPSGGLLCPRWCITYKQGKSSGRHGCFGRVWYDEVQPTVSHC